MAENQYTQEEVQDMLNDMIDESGSQAKVAHMLGMSRSYLNDIIQGKRQPGNAVMQHFGLKKCVTYIKEASQK